MVDSVNQLIDNGNMSNAKLAHNDGMTHRVQAVRRFNRFYTRRIGVLQRRILGSAFSLTEVRVLYELAHCDGLSAAELCAQLDLDAGYVSRIVQAFGKRGLLARAASASDGRRIRLRLTAKGRHAFAQLDGRAAQEIEALLEQLPAGEQQRLVAALQTVETLLGGGAPASRAFVLRPPGPGDLGWVVQRHGAIYAHEHGWNREFEALVAKIVVQFAERQDPDRERCWIAERDGAPVGCVFLVRQSRVVARLRLLLVEPSARGLGIGARLVDECIRFARAAQYRKMVLWTNSVLRAARHLYEDAGFQLVQEGQHHSFGHDLVEQTWELAL
jgi:DNA-binding MarR family transcriptional regulator/N-acetylglutamate synthase-like GNAT family acetyltransferase